MEIKGCISAVKIYNYSLYINFLLRLFTFWIILFSVLYSFFRIERGLFIMLSNYLNIGAAQNHSYLKLDIWFTPGILNYKLVVQSMTAIQNCLLKTGMFNHFSITVT